jgi:hypothetical protein
MAFHIKFDAIKMTKETGKGSGRAVKKQLGLVD